MMTEEVSVQLGQLMLAVAVPVGTSKVTPAPGDDSSPSSRCTDIG